MSTLRPRTSIRSHRSQPTSSPFGMWSDIPQVVDDSSSYNHLVVPQPTLSPRQSPSERSHNGSFFTTSSPGLTFDRRTMISSVDGDEYDPGSWAIEDVHEPPDSGLGLATGHPWSKESTYTRGGVYAPASNVPFPVFEPLEAENGPEPDPGYGFDAGSALNSGMYYKAAQSNTKEGKIKKMMAKVAKGLSRK